MPRNRLPLRACVLCLTLVLLTGSARAAYQPKGCAAAAGARNIVLIYNSGNGHRDWQQADFLPLLAYQDASGALRTPMFDSLLILPLLAPSGRDFYPGFGSGPSNLSDWMYYADQVLFAGKDHLRHLDAAAAQVATALGAPKLRWKVFLTIPYPDPDQHDFGTPTGSDHSLDFANIVDRLAAVQWYIRHANVRWSSPGYPHLEFAGWYWLNEQIPTGDVTLLPQIAAMVHNDSRKFLWIPYYSAMGFAQWRNWGFDTAIYQPNYFFTSTLPYSRLTDTATAAKQYGMGVELEFDNRVLTSADYRARYEDYLTAGRTTGFQSGAVTAWYMGGDALLQCAKSTDSAVRAIYDHTYNFIAEVPVPGDMNGNRIVDGTDAKVILQAGGGLSASSRQGVSTGDVTQDTHLSILDAVKVLRYVNGLQPTLP